MEIGGMRGAGGTDPLQALSKAIVNVSTDTSSRVHAAEKPDKQVRTSEAGRNTSEEIQRLGRELQNVVSVSEDGDTVQASESGLEKLEEE